MTEPKSISSGGYEHAVRREGEDGAASNALYWFGIRVRSRSEVRSYDELMLRGFQAFLPLRTVKRRWSDRTKIQPAPVFPGYVFCRFDLTERIRILSVPGVAQILGAGSNPIPIGEREIESVRAMVNSKIALVPWPYLQAGQYVRIDGGPLAGVEGRVVRADDGHPRVVVSVSLLQRAVAAEIDREWIGYVRKVDGAARAMKACC
jgi:transcription antitermination factor NusG